MDVGRDIVPIYINSANRTVGNPNDFNIRLADVGQKFEKSHVSVANVQIPYSYYSVNSTNNTFSSSILFT